MNKREHTQDDVLLASFLDEKRGNLYVGEGKKNIPFEIKRFFVISGISEGAQRASHAHKKVRQALFCLRGSCEISFDNGREKWKVTLHEPDRGVLLEEKVWHIITKSSSDALILVVADGYYDEDEYLRNYEEFLKFVA